jgi:hypothetical protein
MRSEFFHCSANCGLLGLLGALTNFFEDPKTLNFKASFNLKKTHKVTSDVLTMCRIHGIMVQNVTISMVIGPSQKNVSCIHTHSAGHEFVPNFRRNLLPTLSRWIILFSCEF